MLHVKKLRLLQRKGGDLDARKVVDKTAKYLVSVGDAIAAAAAQTPAPAVLAGKLWQVGLMCAAAAAKRRGLLQSW